MIHTILPLNGRLVKFFDPYYAYVYYKDRKLDLLTGRWFSSSLEQFEKRLGEIKLTHMASHPVIFHLFYELGYYFMEEETSLSPLSIEIRYGKWENYIPVPIKQKISLKLLQKTSFDRYKQKMNCGIEELIKGNCYQFNLTTPTYYEFKGTPEEFVGKVWKNPKNWGAYAHCTYIAPWKRLYLSNSPECLFGIKRKRNRISVYSMPIKGSVPLESDWRRSWKKLASSKKNEGELYMITDLIRNDLAKIQRPSAVVLAKKKPLQVPGILHQYSLVKVDLNHKTRLSEVVRALFPGGSVTGAPKKRVMKILRNLEDGERGFYCGSTLVLFKSLMAASINIRSVEVDFDKYKMVYHSGGGITLLSRSKEEFLEMELKRKSFMDLFLFLYFLTAF